MIMTNFERIKAMSVKEFITFLKYCNFENRLPIIEGHRFHTKEELIEWFNEEVHDIHDCREAN